MKNLYNVSMIEGVTDKLAITFNSKTRIIPNPFVYIRGEPCVLFAIYGNLKQDNRSKSLWKIYRDGKIMRLSGKKRTESVAHLTVMEFDFHNGKLDSQIT